MRRAAPLAALATLAAVPATAATPAAKLRLDHRCYHPGQAGKLTGSGFAPKGHWKATLDGRPFGKGRVGDEGGLAGAFTAPRGRVQFDDIRHHITVSDGKNKASITLAESALSAWIAPTHGNPRTLRVRFTAIGFGAGHAVWLHYIDPKGKVRRNTRLGRAGGLCGHVQTARIRLFPFKAERGGWRLLFTRNATYRATDRPAVLLPFRIR